MSKIRKYLILLLIIIVIIFVSPLIVGRISKKQITKLVTNLNHLEKNKGIHIEIESFNQGWFKSKATFKIKLFKGKYYNEQVTILNGPIILDSSVNSFLDRFNIAYFKGSFKYSPINIPGEISTSALNFNYKGIMKYNLDSTFKISFNKFIASFGDDNINSLNDLNLNNYLTQHVSSFNGNISINKGADLIITTNPSVNKIKINGALNKVKLNYNIALPVDKNNMQKTVNAKASIGSINLSSTSSDIFNGNWQTVNLITEYNASAKTKIYNNDVFALAINQKPTKLIYIAIYSKIDNR